MIQYMRSGKLMAPVNKRKNGEKKIYNEDCLFGFGSKALEVVVLDLIGQRHLLFLKKKKKMMQSFN